MFLSTFLFNCEKEDPIKQPPGFDEISFSYIKESEQMLSGDPIAATDASGHLIDDSNVFIYKTTDDRFGKMVIMDIDDDNNKAATIKAITYNNDGTVYSQTESLLIRGTFSCDLDEMVEPTSNAEVKDFWWRKDNATDTFLEPRNNALFTKL